jgi:hypothetical protein
MSVTPQTNAEQPPVQEQKQSDKEYNFAQIRKQLEQERMARQQAEQRAQELERLAQEKQNVGVEDETSDEPYVDHRRLEKRIAKSEQKSKAETRDEIKNAVNTALAEERKSQWLKGNPDFYEIMGHAQTFAEKDPELAETILQMPDTFERQKLVYKNIKALGLHKKEEPKSTIQDKINQNQRSPFYQPSGMSGPGYAQAGDFSEVGQKNAYTKMKELQARLRLG